MMDGVEDLFAKVGSVLEGVEQVIQKGRGVFEEATAVPLVAGPIPHVPLPAESVAVPAQAVTPALELSQLQTGVMVIAGLALLYLVLR